MVSPELRLFRIEKLGMDRVGDHSIETRTHFLHSLGLSRGQIVLLADIFNQIVKFNGTAFYVLFEFGGINQEFPVANADAVLAIP